MDTHDKILAAANQLLVDGGLEALSFRKVAERAGISVGTVQYYFATMDQLVDALTDPWHDGLTAILKRTAKALPMASDREELLLDMCVEIYRLGLENRPLLLSRRVDTLGRGELLSRRQQAAFKWIDRGSVLAATLVGGTAERWRLLVTAIEHIIVGFALSERTARLGASDAEMEAFLRDAIRGLGHGALGLGKD